MRGRVSDRQRERASKRERERESYMGNRGNSRANTCIHTRLRKRVVFTSYRTNPGSAWPCGVILELIHAPIPDSDEGMSLVVTEPTQALPGLVVFHNNQTNRTASVGDFD